MKNPMEIVFFDEEQQESFSMRFESFDTVAIAALYNQIKTLLELDSVVNFGFYFYDSFEAELVFDMEKFDMENFMNIVNQIDSKIKEYFNE